VTLGLGVLLSVFLLAPGLAIYAALFPSSSARGIRFAPPPPGSILTLTVIGFGALIAHAIWATLAALQFWVCSGTRRCLAVPFDPNMYTAMLAVNEHSNAVTAVDVAISLLTIVIMSAIAFNLASFYAASAGGRGAMRNVLFGWLSDFVELAEPDGRYTTAFVLTSTEHDGAYLGYEGLVENLAVNSDREITAVTLIEVNRFVVCVTGDGVLRRDVDRPPLDRIYLDRANIKNIALTVYEDADA